MAREIRVEHEGAPVVGTLVGPIAADRAPIVLAHGAGAGSGHPFMVSIRDRLASAGHTVLSFDYPYVRSGRRAPDRIDVLAASHRSAAEWLAAETGSRVVLAGRSMGGRVGSHVASEGVACAALVFLAYPLLPAGKPEPRSTDHLASIEAPMLFVSGSRDRMAPLDLLRPVVDSLPEADLAVIPDADHAFRTPKRAGIGIEVTLDRIAGIIVPWLAEKPDQRAGGGR